MNVKIIYKGIEFDVECYYQPFEPAEKGPEAQYPGCPETIEEISDFEHKGTDFLEWIEDDLEEVKEIILNTIHEQ